MQNSNTTKICIESCQKWIYQKNGMCFESMNFWNTNCDDGIRCPTCLEAGYALEMWGNNAPKGAVLASSNMSESVGGEGWHRVVTGMKTSTQTFQNDSSARQKLTTWKSVRWRGFSNLPKLFGIRRKYHATRCGDWGEGWVKKAVCLNVEPYTSWKCASKTSLNNWIIWSEKERMIEKIAKSINVLHCEQVNLGRIWPKMRAVD